jgi:hypothetical protein
MKKIYFLMIPLVLLSSCAAYKFQKGEAPYDQGYVVAKDGKVIPEYTIGKDNSVPDLRIAQERFNRRKLTVEQYYQKMGYIKSRTKEIFVDPPVMAAKFIGGFFRLPFIAVSNYKYNHNPAYKEKVDKQTDQRLNEERNRINALKAELNSYIRKDIESEPLRTEVVETVPAVQEKPVMLAEAKKPLEAQQPEETVAESSEVAAEPEIGPFEPAVSEDLLEPAQEEAVAAEEASKVKKVPFYKRIFKSKPKPAPVQKAPEVLRGEPNAVIIAKPQTGYSPLKVHFYGTNSRSPNGKIIAYEWDFGDGDKSTKPNPINTFYSTSFEPRSFTVILTVTDSKGGVGSTTTTVQVLNK